MNGKLILSIVAAIVLIHVGIVWYLFVDGRPSKPKTPAASAASSQADKPGAPAATAAPGSPATAGAQTAARAQAPQPVSLRTNPNSASLSSTPTR
jgi:flagellar basal body-associated protein FliL